MAKIINIYGSTTGNTQSVAKKIGSNLSKKGHEVTTKNVTEATIEELKDYDTIIFGSSTWNDGELQDDFIEYHMKLESTPPDLKGKKFAVFGCGESVYEQFCTAVDTLTDSLSKFDATKLLDGLKIDGYPEDDENVTKIDNWITSLLDAIK